MQQELTLAELADASGLQSRTIRSWVAQGLLPGPLTRGPAARYPRREHHQRGCARAPTRGSTMRGSRKHMLDWIDHAAFPAELALLVAPTLALQFWRELPHMPIGHADPREARLEQWRPTTVGSPAAWKELDAWWLAASRGASTPNWDFAASALLDGVPGLVLIEAKANVPELSAGGVKTPASESAGSQANDAQIRLALAEASAELARFAPSAALSADHGYQLSNRVAFAWKLASMGIPTLLVYLGFTGDTDIADVGAPLRDDSHWTALVRDYADSLGIGALLERRLEFAAPMWTLVRSRPVTQ